MPGNYQKHLDEFGVARIAGRVRALAHAQGSGLRRLLWSDMSDTLTCEWCKRR